MTKAVDIGGPYDYVRASCKDEQSSMRKINAQTNLFLTNVTLLFYKLWRITRWGGCNGQSNCCIAAGHEPTISVDESLRRRRKSIKLAGPGLIFATFTKWAAQLARRRPWSRYADWHLRQLSTPLPKPPAPNHQRSQDEWEQNAASEALPQRKQAQWQWRREPGRGKVEKPGVERSGT